MIDLDWYKVDKAFRRQIWWFLSPDFSSTKFFSVLDLGREEADIKSKTLMRRKIRRISIKFRRMTQILCDEYNVFVASDETQDTKIFRLLS